MGEGAFVDHAFNTTDVLIVMDTARFRRVSGRFMGAMGRGAAMSTESETPPPESTLRGPAGFLRVVLGIPLVC